MIGTLYMARAESSPVNMAIRSFIDPEIISTRTPTPTEPAIPELELELLVELDFAAAK